MCRALVKLFDSQDADEGFARSVHDTFSILRSPHCLTEFKRGGRPLKHHRHVSPAHVFPLLPMSHDSKLLGWSDSSGGVDDECLFFGGNLVVAALNWLHGGWSTPPEVLTAAHERVHARIASTLTAVVITDETVLSPLGLDNFTTDSQL